MKRRYIREAWNDCREKVIPGNASEAQLRDMRSAFFGGAMIVWVTLLNNVSESDEHTAQDQLLGESIEAELKAYQEELKRRLCAINSHSPA